MKRYKLWFIMFGMIVFIGLFTVGVIAGKRFYDKSKIVHYDGKVTEKGYCIYSVKSLYAMVESESELKKNDNEKKMWWIEIQYKNDKPRRVYVTEYCYNEYELGDYAILDENCRITTWDQDKE